MARFRKRRVSSDEPSVGAVVGFTSVIITRDKSAYMNQQHHHEVPPHLVAEVAAVSWALWATLDALESDGATTALARLRALLAVDEASVLNARVNAAGLIPNNPPDVVSPEGLEASAMIRTLSNGHLTAVWSGFEHFKGNYDALLRVFAALWTIAERHGSGPSVRHGLQTLLNEDRLVESLNPRGLFTLPGELLEAGATHHDSAPAPAVSIKVDPNADAGSDMPIGASARARLTKSMEAISDLVAAGTIDPEAAKDMRDRALERYEADADDADDAVDDSSHDGSGQTW